MRWRRGEGDLEDKMLINSELCRKRWRWKGKSFFVVSVVYVVLVVGSANAQNHTNLFKSYDLLWILYSCSWGSRMYKAPLSLPAASQVLFTFLGCSFSSFCLFSIFILLYSAANITLFCSSSKYFSQNIFGMRYRAESPNNFDNGHNFDNAHLF